MVQYSESLFCGAETFREHLDKVRFLKKNLAVRESKNITLVELLGLGSKI